MTKPMRKMMVRIAFALALVVVAGIALTRALSPVWVSAMVVVPTEILGTVKGPGTVQSKVQVTRATR